MRTTKEQLRRIIREAVKRKLQEAPEGVNFQAEVGGFLASALGTYLEEDDVVGSNAWEMMMGTLGEDELPVPGRVEDLDPLAELVTEHVLQDSQVRDAVKGIAKNLLDNLMDYAGEDFTPRGGQ